jgi:hypothetical protein
VGAPLDEPSLVQNQYRVRFHGRAQPVSDYQGGPSPAHVRRRFLRQYVTSDFALRPAIQRRGRFIEEYQLLVSIDV